MKLQKILFLLSVIIITSMNSSAQVNFTTGLKTYHPFNSDYYNAAGNINYHHNFYNASFGADSFAVSGNAALFNGSTRVNVFDRMVYDNVANFSIDFWFRSISASTGVLYWEGLLNQQDVWIRMEPASNRIRTNIGTPALFNQVSTTATFNDGAWHHFALTASGGNAASVYIDGTLNASTSATFDTSTTTNFTRFGCRDDITQFFNGELDNFRVWKRTLSAGEVLDIFNLPSITLGAVTPNAICAGASASLPFTVSGGSGQFQAGNSFYAQLSDLQGSFIYPVIIGQLAGTVSGTIPITIPANISTGSNYRIRIMASQYPMVSLNFDSVTVYNADAFTNYNTLSNLIIHYPFDGNANDTSGNSINATIVSGVTSDTGHTGVPNTALRFNGTNSKITLGRTYPVNIMDASTQSFSTSVWLYQRSTPGIFGYIFSCWDGNIPDGVWLGTTSAGKLRIRINNNNSLEASITNNTWVHAVAVYNGANLKLYINGVQSGGTQTTSGNIVIAANPHIGWDAIANNQFYDGSLDDFRFYTRALTADEAAILYRGGSLISSNSPLCSGTLQLNGPAYPGIIYDWTGPDNFSSIIEDPAVNPFNSFTNTGVYSLTMQLNGCTGTPQTTLVESTVPAVTAVASDTICTGEIATVSAQGAVGLQEYYWYADAAGTTLLASDTSSYSYSPSITDTVYVALFDGTSCFSELVPATVTVNALPLVIFSLTTNTFCNNSSPVSLTATPLGGIFSGNSVTGNNFDPAAAGVGNYVLNYSFTDLNGCTSSDTESVTVTICTGINEENAANDFYFQQTTTPNIFALITNKQFDKIEIYNTNGSLVGNKTAHNKPLLLDMNNYAKGIYLIRVLNEGKAVCVMKLIR